MRPKPVNAERKNVHGIAPLGRAAIRALLGHNDVVRLLSLVERDIRHSNCIPDGKRHLVWTRISGQRADPEIAGCLSTYLTGGDIAEARARLRRRLGEVLKFGDTAIDDERVVELVVCSIENNLFPCDGCSAGPAHGRRRRQLRL